MQNFIEKNYKTPLKKTSSKKTQINVEIYHVNELKNKFFKTGKSPQTKQQNQCNPNENPNGILVDLDKHPKINTKVVKAKKSQDILEKREGKKVGEHALTLKRITNITM